MLLFGVSRSLVLMLGSLLLLSPESESASITSTPQLGTERLTAAGSGTEAERRPVVDSTHSPAATETHLSHTPGSKEPVGSGPVFSNSSATAGTVAMDTSNNTSSRRPALTHISTVRPAVGTQPPPDGSVSKTENATERHQQSPVTFMSSPAWSTLHYSASAFSTQASTSVRETTKVSIPPASSSPTALSLTSPSPSQRSDISAVSTSGSATEMPNTSSHTSPIRQHTSHQVTAMSSIATGFPTASEAIVSVSDVHSVPSSQSTATSTPRPHTSLPGSTSMTSTTIPCPSYSPPISSCMSKRGVVTQCLIIIASLGGLATIFIISTIVLCTKLSSRNYRANNPPRGQQGTEMMCISSLLPDKNYTYSRQRNPVSNGVLLIADGGDSEDDNVTLSSFLPDNDRFV